MSDQTEHLAVVANLGQVRLPIGIVRVDSETGNRSWGSKIGRAIGIGVIACDTGRGQRVAAATGLAEVLWPTEIATAKVVVLGLPGG